MSAIGARFLKMRWPGWDSLCVFCILAAGLITQTWFRDDKIIMGGDYVFRITPQEEFRQTFYIWQNNRSGGIGAPVFDMAELFPYRIMLVLVDLMGGSLATGQRVVFYYLLTVSGLSAYYLGRTVLPPKGMYVGSLACALFYMFNTYAIFFKWIDRLMSLFTYCMVPLLLALYIQMLEADRGRHKLTYAVLIALVSTTMASTQPAYFLLGVMPLPLFCAYYLLCLARNNSARLKVLIASSIAVLLMVIVNIWWIAPLFLTFRETQSEILNYKLSAANFGASLVLNSAETSFLNIVRLVGYWALKSNFKGEPYLVNAHHYFSTEFTLASFLLAGLVFIPLLASRDSRRKMIVYFAMLAVSSLFLVEGVHPPLGQVFAWLYRNVPLFILLESQYEKAGVWVVLAYAVLLGFFFSKLSGRFSWRPLRALVLGILFSLLFVYLPSSFWDGTIVPPSRGQFLKSYRVAVPDYYYEAAGWFRQQPDDFRIAVLPPATIRSYSWSGIFDPATFSLLYGKTLFSFDPETSYLASLYGQPSSQGFLNALRLYNVKYIQLEKDFDADSHNTPSVQSALTLLEQSPDAHYVRSFGELDIYQIDQFVPHIYAPVAIRNCPACPEVFADEAFSSQQGFPPALFFLRDLPLSQREAVEQSFDVNLDADFTTRLFPPQINAEKVDDTHYRVSVKNATKPYLLVFAEAYRPFWKAYIVNPKKPDVLAGTPFETLFLEPLSEQFHWTINGYANGWWVNQTGDYEIILEYWSQRAIWPCLFVSSLAIVGCLGGLLVLGAPWKRLRGARRFGFEQTS